MATETADPNAGKGYQTLSIPVNLNLLGTSALDLMTDWTPGFDGNVIGMEFLTNTPGTGASASQTITVTIGGVATVGGVLTLLLADTTPTGKIKEATAITDRNHFLPTDLVSVKVAASGTAFTGGSGVLVLTLQNVQNF